MDRGRLQCTYPSTKSLSCSRTHDYDSVFNVNSVHLRMDGKSALDLWDLVIEVLHSASDQARARATCCVKNNLFAPHTQNATSRHDDMQDRQWRM